MNKIGIIYKREFLSRFRNRTFIIMTILGPLLIAGIFIVPMWLEKMEREQIKHVAIIDETHLLGETIENFQSYRFTLVSNTTVERLRENLSESGYDAVLFIPHNIYHSNWAILYSHVWIDDALRAYISYVLRRDLEYMALMKENVSYETIKRVSSPVFVGVQKWTKDGVYVDDDDTFSRRMAIAYGAGFLLYMFVFVYGVLVLRGVIEEKTNRVIEIIVSSVKPVQLMAGKILGIGTVGLIQFLVWTILTLGIVFTAQVTLFADLYNPLPLPETGYTLGESAASAKQLVSEHLSSKEYAINLFESLDGIKWNVMILAFIFFFVFGYLLYAAIYAAIGAVIDQDTDAQQFVLPVSLPLLFSILVLQIIISNPEGSLAFWLSIFPLTSPVIMLARLPFGIPYWELLLSVAVLILSCVIVLYFAAKMYKAGILLYGKKISISSLFKVVFSHKK